MANKKLSRAELIRYAISCVIRCGLPDKTENGFEAIRLLFEIYDEQESIDKGYLKVSDIS